MSFVITHGWKKSGAVASTLLTGLVSYWKLDESSGNALDSVGSNHLSLTGGVTQGAAGKIGTAYTFNGSTGRLNLASAVIGTLPFTVSFWMKGTGAVSLERILSIKAANNNNLYSIYSDAIGRPVAQHWDGSQAIATFGSVAKNGNWNHIVALFTSNSSRSITMNNAAFVTETTAQNALTVTLTQIAYFNFNSLDQQYYNGSLDEIGIWNRILTADEITELYNSGSGKTYPFT